MHNPSVQIKMSPPILLIISYKNSLAKLNQQNKYVDPFSIQIKPEIFSHSHLARYKTLFRLHLTLLLESQIELKKKIERESEPTSKWNMCLILLSRETPTHAT